MTTRNQDRNGISRAFAMATQQSQTTTGDFLRQLQQSVEAGFQPVGVVCPATAGNLATLGCLSWLADNPQPTRETWVGWRAEVSLADRQAYALRLLDSCRPESYAAVDALVRSAREAVALHHAAAPGWL